MGIPLVSQTSSLQTQASRKYSPLSTISQNLGGNGILRKQNGYLHAQTFKARTLLFAKNMSIEVRASSNYEKSGVESSA